MAFVTAAAAIRHFWSNRAFSKEITEKSYRIGERLQEMRERQPGILGVRGRGMIFGVECSPAELAGAVTAEAFKRGLILETCGANDQVIKFLPALTTEVEVLERGLDIFEESFDAALEGYPEYQPSMAETR
jgi:diaminobutyrate-2-oxoglutarate transaminase